MRISIKENDGFPETAVDSTSFRRRRRQRKCHKVVRRTKSIDFIAMMLLSLLCMQTQRDSSSFALLPRITTKPSSSKGRHTAVGRIKAAQQLPTDATTSPLFSNRVYKTTPTKFTNPIRQQSSHLSQRKKEHRNPRGVPSARSSLSSPLNSPTALHMVLTTPQSIIEQASTVNLLDDLIDESVRTSARRPIMMQFDPSSGWIWRRWTGTVFAETWMSCVRNMAFALAIFFIHRTYPQVFKTHLNGFNVLWGQLLSVTTFTLTFFVNQSYALWRKCMELSRRLQGRLHDVNMNMASHAERVVPANPNDKSTYTASSRQILELMSRYTRLFNLLTYASFTRSHRPILTPRGLRRLVERGLMTAQEREVLVDAVIPATQRHSVVLMWMIRLFIEGRAAGHIQGGHGFESETMHKFHIIRSQYGAIGDELQGRMPLAYAHIVQVLVDLILWMFPIMAFATGMSPLLVVFGTGLLTMSYQGLFDLAKQFLDPYDNENYGRGEDPLSVDTLIAETNAGSVRWLYGFEELPFSAQRLSDGELYEYLLPVRGYSVEELDEMERERVEREKQLEEQRKREDEEAAAAEAERLRKEAEEEKEREEQELEDDLQAIEMVKELNGVETDEVEANATMAESLEALEALEDLEKVTQLLVNDDDSPTEIADVNGNATKSEVNQETVEEESNDTQIESELETDDASETTKSVHKVTTLATDGSPITSFKPSEQMKPVVEEPVPSGMQTSNYLATLRMQTERIKSLLAAAELEEEDLAEQALLDFEAYQDLPWFDEVGSDGQEFRLSQQLADEDWVEEITDDIRVKNMTKEEYEERLKEIEQNAEDELKETIEIMSATPGDEGQEDIYTVAERKKKKAPTYDQTRLDGISQLWGLPPEDPSALTEYEPPEKVDDVDFSSISQLWGGGALSDTPSGTTTVQKQDDSDLVGMGSFAGISELWGPTGNYLQEDIGSLDSDAFPKNKTISESGEEEDEGPGEYVSFMGLPWHDEKGPDGQDYRLSQMLADEEWASDSESEEEKPMTLEDYNEQVKEITEKLEEELRETEAILMSKPGTDPVGWDYDDEQLAPMSNVTNAEEEEEPVKDSDLAVLEMDVDVDEELKAPEDVSGDAEAATVNGDAEEADSEPAIPTGDAEIDEGLEPNGGDSVVMASTDKLDIDAMIGGDSSSDEEIMEVSDIDETVTEAPSDQLEEESSDVMDETPSTDGKNKIEPIFLEEQDEGQDVVESPPTADDDGEEEDDVRL